jgi:hypothetical protein
MAELDGLGLFGIEESRKDEPSDHQGGNNPCEEVKQTATERVRHKIGIVRQDGINNGCDPPLLGRFFRGWRLVFHGVDPSCQVNGFFLRKRKDKRHEDAAYLPARRGFVKEKAPSKM